MKSIALKIFSYLLALCIISCSNDDVPKIDDSSLTCFDGILNGDEVTIDCGGKCPGFCPTESIGILKGEVVQSGLQLNAAIEYRLTGPYLIRDGASLSIPAGTIIKAEPGIGAYIAVAQGGQLNVFGQADNPVIITSGAENPAPGDWGGIVICGKAPINSVGIGRSDIIDIFYGGPEIDDSSGVYNYLRIEYAGAFVNNQKFDAIAFYGVGSFTTVTRLQSFESSGNGIRFIGGNLNTKWIAATNSGENGIAMTNDWNGKSDSWYISGSSKSGIKISSDTENPNEMALDSVNNISIIGPLAEGGINYASGNGRYIFTDIYTSNLDFGLFVTAGLVTSNIDLGNYLINAIEFDNQPDSFVPTNYMGTNTSFYSESITAGAGNRELIPIWAEGWTRGLD